MQDILGQDIKPGSWVLWAHKGAGFKSSNPFEVKSLTKKMVKIIFSNYLNEEYYINVDPNHLIVVDDILFWMLEKENNDDYRKSVDEAMKKLDDPKRHLDYIRSKTNRNS